MNVRQEDNSKNKERLYLYTDIQIHIYIYRYAYIYESERRIFLWCMFHVVGLNWFCSTLLCTHYFYGCLTNVLVFYFI